MTILAPLPALLLLGLAPSAAAGTLSAGDPFPSWSLVDQDGVEVASDDYAGKKVLVWFYPKAMTPGCTAEGQGLRDRVDAFEEKGVAILGVSFDTPEDNARFAGTHDFPFRLLSDVNRELALSVGAATTADQPYAKRISYLVGEDGKVVEVYGEVDPKTHAADVLSDL